MFFCHVALNVYLVMLKNVFEIYVLSFSLFKLNELNESHIIY